MSDELQISFIYFPNMIMTVIKIIIAIKVIVTVATNCWVFNTSQVYLQNNLEKWTCFSNFTEGKTEVQREKILPQAVKIWLVPGYFHVQHTIYVSILFLEETEKETEGRGGLRELYRSQASSSVSYKSTTMWLYCDTFYSQTWNIYHLVQSKTI